MLEGHALEADVEEFSPVAVEVEGVEMLVVSGIFYVQLLQFLEQHRIVSFRGLGIQPKDRFHFYERTYCFKYWPRRALN